MLIKGFSVLSMLSKLPPSLVHRPFFMRYTRIGKIAHEKGPGYEASFLQGCVGGGGGGGNRLAK